VNEVRDAIILANRIASEWRSALRDGINLEEYRSVLQHDLEHLKQAMTVITDHYSGCEK
jgi:hypothetical protein